MISTNNYICFVIIKTQQPGVVTLGQHLRYFKINLSGVTAFVPSINADRTSKGCKKELHAHAQVPQAQPAPLFDSGSSFSLTNS